MSKISRHDWLKDNESEYGPGDLNRAEDARDIERGRVRALGAQPAERPQTRQSGFFGLLGERRRATCRRRPPLEASTREQVERAPISVVLRGLRIRSAHQRVR